MWRSKLFLLMLLGICLILCQTDSARAITFTDWATAQGYNSGDIMLDSVDASSATIDSLTGIGNYDWLTTPTTSLSLQKNQITSIESGVFSGLGNLTKLYLDSNQLTSIEPGDFSGLANLTHLYFNGNQITSIEPGDFSGLDNLTWIDFNANQLTTINSGDFSELGNLKVLYLNNNQITDIEPGDFSGPGNLTHLNLSGNPIKSIDSGDFSGLSNLTSLTMNVSQITSIEPGDFSGLSNLTNLSMLYNEITSFEAGDFNGLGKLKYLFLRGNPITSIESGDFSGLGQLMYLELNYNQITSIGSGSFSEVRGLQYLYLQGNPITNIESGAFSDLANLSTLYMGNNTALTELNFDESDFSSRLTLFDLSNNTNITRVSLKNVVLYQKLLTVLVDGGSTNKVGIGELPSVTELDLSGVDFAAITSLSPLYVMDDLTDLWIVDAENLNAGHLDMLLNNLATMQSTGTEGVLYMTSADFEALNTAGGGLLAAWDAETGHHVQIVPEPSVLILLAMLVGSLLAYGRQRRP